MRADMRSQSTRDILPNSRPRIAGGIIAGGMGDEAGDRALGLFLPHIRSSVRVSKQSEIKVAKFKGAENTLLWHIREEGLTSCRLVYGI